MKVDKDIELEAVWGKDSVTPVKILWDDNNNEDGLRPKLGFVTVMVSTGGGNYTDVSVREKNGWTTTLDGIRDVYVSWACIDRTDEHPNGVDTEGQYRVETTHTIKDGYTFKLIHTPIKTTSVSGKVLWVDDKVDGRYRPDEVTVRLFKGEEEVSSKTVSRKDRKKKNPFDLWPREDEEEQFETWLYSFDNLQRYDENGNYIEYTVKEDGVRAYNTLIDGHDIINECCLELVDMTGTVIWDDDNNSKKKRPENVTLILFKNGVKDREITVNGGSEPTWYWGIGDVPVVDEYGHENTFTIEEKQVDGYDTSVTTDKNYIFTNKLDITDVYNCDVQLSSDTHTYNGEVQKPSVTAVGGETLTEGDDYKLEWSNESSRDPGTYSVTIVGTGDYSGQVTKNYVINKAANTLKIKGKKAKVSYSKIKKKKKSLAVSKVMKFINKGQGQLSYKLLSVKAKKKSFMKKFKINKNTGKLTLAKGLKKGTYTVTINVMAAGHDTHEASEWATVKSKIIIK